ncbi:MAG: hypothetical protein ACRC5T_05270 [Cetobacterium sp.]
MNEVTVVLYDIDQVSFTKNFKILVSDVNLVQSKIEAVRNRYGAKVSTWTSNGAVTGMTISAVHVNTWVDRMATLANQVVAASQYKVGTIARPGRVVVNSPVKFDIFKSIIKTGDVCLSYCNYVECNYSECNKSESNSSESNSGGESNSGSESDRGSEI